MVRFTRRHSRTLAAASLSLCLGGCELAKIQVASPPPTVVVHAVLNPDADEQVVLVEQTLTGRVTIDSTLRFNPLDPIRTAGGSPVTDADVRLLADGDSVGVLLTETRRPGSTDVPAPGAGTGRYHVSRNQLAVLPGHRYRLRIKTADGIQVTGETRIPTAGAGWTPGQGSATVPATMFRSTDTLRVNWNPVPDARKYVIRVETPDGPWFLFSDSTRFNLAGSLRNFFAGNVPSVWYPGFLQPLSVVAVDANYYDYNRSGNDPFGGSGLISSVRGGIGMFGSVLPLLRRDVSVTDRDVSPLDARWVGTSAIAEQVEWDLWVESPGPTISSVSGRVRSSPNRYIVGTLEGTLLRLATLDGISREDTISAFTGRLAGDSISGTYNTRFASDGPLVFRRRPRTP